MNKLVDLHVHSHYSDGTYSPKELVDYACSKGLSAFALTDHDTTEGLEEAISYALDSSVQVIPGIELSTEYEGRDIHILGLYIDYHKPSFKASIQAFVDSRIERNQKMCRNLQKAGIDITYESLLAAFPNSVITRSHYARYLLDKGYIKSMAEAFERFIGDHSPCFVPREKVTPLQAVQLILDADGIPILAHPTLYRMSDSRLDKLVGELKSAGLAGIEGIYPTYTKGEERHMRALASKYHLLLSGGSDFHGSNKPKLDLATGYGNLAVPESILEKLNHSRMHLIFSDMDGTLLNDESRISANTKAAIHNLSEKGHKLILTSGRPLNSILEVKEMEHLEDSGMLIISNNGSLVYDCDGKAPLKECRLTKQDMRFLIKEAQNMGLHCHAYTDTHIISYAQTKELEFYTSRIHLPVHIVPDIVDFLDKGSYKLQVISLTDKSRLEAFRAQVSSFCEGKIQAIFSNDYYLEFLPLEAGKGNALRFVCDYFHVPISHSYACGDAQNDLSMLEAAGTAVVMKNGDEGLKELADIITEKDNNHDGLVPLMESLPIIK